MTADALLVLVEASPSRFSPLPRLAGARLVFIVGAGVAAEAHAPLLRPIAEAGYPVFIVKLPFRLVLLEGHKQVAEQRVQAML